MGSTYRAFISYSHSDAPVARWLHARLETYRLPGEIAQLVPAGERKGRLGPIFRDREELPASQDLSASVRAALAASDVLVVLCSPEACASLWVKREIELFRELHPDRRILAAIVRGEPGEAIPEPLMEGREPLAADLRKEGDGRRLGFLKIVAGIAGVPLDALVQRDAQRKLRRVMAVTLVTAAAALAMAIMTVIAIQSRNEAERQRAEAEGLIEYMLSDLRSELRGVGRLDVMRGVNERALDYYAGQGDLEGLPGDSLDRRARVLHAMVEDESNREGGDLELAGRMASEAYQTTALLLETDSGDADLVFSHAQSEYWTGRVFEIGENYRSARPWYTRYDTSARLLGQIEPASRRSFMERGFGSLNLGIVVFRIEGSGEQAVQLFQAAISWFEHAVERDPGDDFAQQQLANAWSWLSNVHYNAGKFANALAAQERAARIKSTLAEAKPLDKERHFDLLIAERALALAHLRLGHRDIAMASLRRLVRETGELSASDPANSNWRYVADRAQADLQELN
jgi:tetratricopeptide (TPR) repeat protein